MSDTKWERVGAIGVDAGLCWIGDPCYVLHKEEGAPTSIGADWGEFCDRMGRDVTQFNYDLGHAGLGVCVATGYGDGFYPVEVRRSEDGRIAEVRVVFIPEAESEDE